MSIPSMVKNEYYNVIGGTLLLRTDILEALAALGVEYHVSDRDNQKYIFVRNRMGEWAYKITAEVGVIFIRRPSTRGKPNLEVIRRFNNVFDLQEWLLDEL